MFFLGAFNLLVVKLQVPLLQQGNGQPEPARCYPCLPELQFKADSKVCSKKSWNPDPFHVNMFFFQKKTAVLVTCRIVFHQLHLIAISSCLQKQPHTGCTWKGQTHQLSFRLSWKSPFWGNRQPVGEPHAPNLQKLEPVTHQPTSILTTTAHPESPTFPMTRALPVWQAAARAVSWELLRWWRSAWKKTPQPSWGINLPPTNEVSVKVWDEKW